MHIPASFVIYNIFFLRSIPTGLFPFAVHDQTFRPSDDFSGCTFVPFVLRGVMPAIPLLTPGT